MDEPDAGPDAGLDTRDGGAGDHEARRRLEGERHRLEGDTLEQVAAELADVELALRRLDEGSYGTCEVCGADIGDERLEARPAVRFCLDHQQPAEHQHRGERSE